MAAGELDPNSYIYVSAFPLLGKLVMVKTTHKEIMRFTIMNEKEDKELLKRMSNRIYQNLLDFNEHKVVKDMKAGNKQALQEWDDFCADVLILYTIRLVLYDRPIPISPVNEDIPSMGKRNNEYSES